MSLAVAGLTAGSAVRRPAPHGDRAGQAVRARSGDMPLGDSDPGRLRRHPGPDPPRGRGWSSVRGRRRGRRRSSAPASGLPACRPCGGGMRRARKVAPGRRFVCGLMRGRIPARPSTSSPARATATTWPDSRGQSPTPSSKEASSCALAAPSRARARCPAPLLLPSPPVEYGVAPRRRAACVTLQLRPVIAL